MESWYVSFSTISIHEFLQTHLVQTGLTVKENNVTVNDMSFNDISNPQTVRDSLQNLRQIGPWAPETRLQSEILGHDDEVRVGQGSRAESRDMDGSSRTYRGEARVERRLDADKVEREVDGELLLLEESQKLSRVGPPSRPEGSPNISTPGTGANSSRYRIRSARRRSII